MDEFFGVLTKVTEYVQSLSRADIKEFVSTAFWFLVVFAAIQGLRRLNTIREIITEFNKARGPIWDLRGTINEFKELEPVIRQLAEQMSLLDEKVDAARKQVQELQVDSFSSRTEEEDRPAQLSELPKLGAVAAAVRYDAAV
jgi:septal ring factor EnvC (AmiA/AmiB activator)